MARIKPKYNATPTAKERLYHIWLMEALSCQCGCGAQSTVVHHPLTRHPDQRWRRDHEFVVAMANACHVALHARGKDADGMNMLASINRNLAYAYGRL